MSDRPPATVSADLLPEDEDFEGGEQLVLSDLINRVLDKGVVIHAHVGISVADIDLVQLDLRLLMSSVTTLLHRAGGQRADRTVRPGPVA